MAQVHFASSRALPARQAVSGPAPCPAPCRARRDVSVSGFNLSSLSSSATSRGQQQVQLIGVDPTTSAPSSSGQSGPSVPMIALAVGAVAAVAMVAKKLRQKWMEDPMHRYAADMYVTAALKDVNTIQIENLSPDQIEAARARRSKERANHTLSLEEIELPSNHPFATKQALSVEQQEQALQNIRAKSMRRRVAFDDNGQPLPQQPNGPGRRSR